MKPKLNYLQVAQMADQNGAVMALGTEISADVLGIPMVQGAEQMSTKPMSHPNQKGINNALNGNIFDFQPFHVRWKDTLGKSRNFNAEIKGNFGKSIENITGVCAYYQSSMQSYSEYNLMLNLIIIYQDSNI